MDEKLRKTLEHRSYVMREFIESEREYVRRLQIAVDDYYTHIKTSSSENIPPDLKNDMLSIFSTLPEIFTFHKSTFLPDLEASDWKEDTDSIMDCFLSHRSDFHIYLPYCKNKPTSDSVRVGYDKFFTSRQNELGHKLSIEDLLIAPVQRLPKYQLLIRDLLKDTRKAGLETAKIQEAHELMMKIPQETNNVICMSLIRGINRAFIISHGSLWRQNTLLFSCTTSAWTNGDHVSTVSTSCNMKNEPRQVFLFDHRILITAPADSDGFFEYQMDLKTLNGKVTEESDDACTFRFTTESNVTCYFKASSPAARQHWVKDIRDILHSQEQMKKALVTGKSLAIDPKTVRMNSLSVGWSDSDSSIDSMPESEEEQEEEDDPEGDWPKHTGYHRVSKPVCINQSAHLTVPDLKSSKLRSPKEKRKDLFRSISLVPRSRSPRMSEGRGRRRKTESTVVMDRLVLDRPLSCNVESVSQLDQSMQRKFNALSVSPRMLRSWMARKSGTQEHRAHIYFPTRTSSPSFDGLRSPDSKHPHDAPISHDHVLFITVGQPPDVAPQLYQPQPGQVFMAEDVSQVEVWKVRVLSGDMAGESVWVQRNCLEEYSAPMSLRGWKKEYQVLQSLSVGRFSKVKLARSKATKELHALKMFQSSTSEDQFYRELCIGVRMKHRNLVSYHVGLQHQHVMTIAMEYVNGRQLLDFLVHKATVNEKLVADLMRQLFDGLEYMHSHTVYHLDIRPENIMMDLAKDALKIIDYGAARHSGDEDELLSKNFEACCNYEYVPPEIFQQVPVGPGTDVWGVGLIIFIIFYGHTPFHDESSVRLIANITRLEYSFPDLDNLPFSKHALELIMDILVLSPSKRPTAEAAKKYSWFTDSEDLTRNRVKLHQLKQFLSKQS